MKLSNILVPLYSDSGAVMKSASLNHRNDLNYRPTHGCPYQKMFLHAVVKVFSFEKKNNNKINM